MKMDLFLALLLILSSSTCTCLQIKPSTSKPVYVVKIFTKMNLIGRNYPRHFCSGALIRRNFVIAGRTCISNYSTERDPSVFVITAGPEIFRPFYNGATINYCKEIFMEEEFTRKKPAITNTSIYIVTTLPFYTSSRIRVAPLDLKIHAPGDRGTAHVLTNRTDVAGLVLRNYLAQVSSNKDCSGRCYTVVIYDRKNDGNNDKHAASYFIVQGFLSGVTFGPYDNITTKKTFYRSDTYGFLLPYLPNTDPIDTAERVNSVLLIMFFLMNVLLIILN